MKLSFKKVLRICAYGSLLAGIVYATVVLVAIGQGYHFNWRTGKLSAGGLLLAESQPEDASVLVDGRPIDKKTPLRLSLRAGQHSLKLYKDGYRHWEKAFTISTAKVTWMKYPILLPDKLTPTKLEQAGDLRQLQLTPDRRHLSWINSSRIRTLEIGTDTPATIFQLSPSQLRAQAKIFKVDWANNSQHLLVTIKSGNKKQHLLIDRNKRQPSVNIESVFRIKPDYLRFAHDNGRALYWLDGGNLRRIDIDGRSISRVLVSSVKKYQVAEDQVFLLQKIDRRHAVTKLDSDDNKQKIIANLSGRDYSFEYLAFGDQKRLALLNKSNHRVELYNPNYENQETFSSFSTVSADSLSISPDGRLLLMRRGNNFVSYDLDSNRLFRFELKGMVGRSVSWFDNYHLLMAIDGKAVIMEFDGQNAQTLLPVASGSSIWGSRDKTAVYMISRGARSSLYLAELPLLAAD